MEQTNNKSWLPENAEGDFILDQVFSARHALEVFKRNQAAEKSNNRNHL